MSNSVPEKSIEGRNGGKLYSGGVPGNKGGGRPKDEVRAMFVENAALGAKWANQLLQRQMLLEEQYRSGEIDKDEFRRLSSNPEIVLRATGESAKYGIGTKTEAEVKLVGDETFKQYFFEVLLDMEVDVDEFQRRLEARMKG